MHILITGAAGMIGRKLTARLAADGALNGRPIETADADRRRRPATPEKFSGNVEAAAADIADPAAVRAAVAGRPEVIFHLAGVVSGEAELDFEKGMRVNLDGSRTLFEAIRALGDGYRPRLVFTSSIAVFGAPFPPAIGDDFHLTPLTSYGTQKAATELLLADYTRRGFLDGIGIRLPSIVVRPGRPNKAASGFFSSIIREPLNGEEAVLPVADSVLHWHASPRAAVGFLVHAAGLDAASLGPASISPCRGSAAPWPSRSRRCGGSPATRWPPASAANPTRWSPASLPAGRAGSIRRARWRSAFAPRARSTILSASILRTNWAARLRLEVQFAHDLVRKPIPIPGQVRGQAFSGSCADLLALPVRMLTLPAETPNHPRFPRP